MIQLYRKTLPPKILVLTCRCAENIKWQFCDRTASLKILNEMVFINGF